MTHRQAAEAELGDVSSTGIGIYVLTASLVSTGVAGPQ